MGIQIEIRRNQDDMIAIIEWDDEEFHRFWWEEGNGSCDCNREIYFRGFYSKDGFEEPKCGDGGFSVRITDIETGTVVYDEF